MLWIYAANDYHMGPALAQAYYKAFTQAGGKAVFDMAPATAAGTDGHQLYSMPDEVAIWTPYLDQFFTAQHLALILPPLTVTVPDVTPPAGLGDSGRQGFATYLAAMPHKAFAMSHSRWGSWTLADSTDAAVAAAMKNCKGTDTDPCKIVMIDDKPAP
jgi:hypothetical protein